MRRIDALLDLELPAPEPLVEPGVYEGINDFEDAAQAYRVVVPEGYAELAPAPLILWLATGTGDLEIVFYGPASDEDALSRLTPRERQVLKLVAEGYSNKEVASALDIAVKTAMAHRANMMDKLNIRNTSKLTQFAIRTGLITID